MGIEVWGREPETEAGMYFRASYWAWRPLLLLMKELCSDLLDADMLEGMKDNNGCGPHDEATCIEMADRIARWLDLFEDASFKPKSLNKGSLTYEVSIKKIDWWVDFLRACGGFEVMQMAFCTTLFSLAFLNTPWHRVRADFRVYSTKPVPFLDLLLHAFCPHRIPA